MDKEKVKQFLDSHKDDMFAVALIGTYASIPLIAAAIVNNNVKGYRIKYADIDVDNNLHVHFRNGTSQHMKPTQK